MREYPRTAAYDPEWVAANWMGPNPLWLLEELCEHLDLRPGMKVLDLGCGKGLTSVFLAKEFGVTVFANDLWIPATENLKRFEEAGVAGLVYPIHAEAHALPYAEEFFDAVIAVDSYHYFGTDEAFFPGVFSKLVKPGGQLGAVCPGYVREYERGYPDTLKHLINPDMYTFHSKGWWRYLWEKTGLADITACYDMQDPKDIWWPWAIWEREHLPFNDWEFLESDTGNELAFIVMTAVKKAAE